MQITKFIDISQEVTFSVSLADIVDSYATTSPEVGLEESLRALGQLPKVIDPIPDSIIAAMSPCQHRIIRNYLLKAAGRFQKIEDAPQNAKEQNGHIAQQAAGMPLETAPDRA